MVKLESCGSPQPEVTKKNRRDAVRTLIDFGVEKKEAKDLIMNTNFKNIYALDSLIKRRIRRIFDELDQHETAIM